MCEGLECRCAARSRRTSTLVRSPYLLGWGAVPGHGIGTSSQDRSPGGLPRPAGLVSKLNLPLRQPTCACGPVFPFRVVPSVTRRLAYSVGTRGSWFGESAKDERPVEVTIEHRDGGVNSISPGAYHAKVCSHDPAGESADACPLDQRLLYWCRGTSSFQDAPSVSKARSTHRRHPCLKRTQT
jgi:hypothetical protein